MQIGDIYKHKETNSLIQIDSFAHYMNRIDSELIIVFRNIEKHNAVETGWCPSENGYGSAEDIENKYELLVKREDLCDYQYWNEIFALVCNYS